MWKLSQQTRPKTQQDIKVKLLLRELIEGTYATYADEFKNHFKERIKEIPRRNNFSADLMFQVTQRNEKSVEVWKMKVNGEFNYKMWQLDYEKC